jgi:hypothetical protein
MGYAGVLLMVGNITALPISFGWSQRLPDFFAAATKHDEFAAAVYLPSSSLP